MSPIRPLYHLLQFKKRYGDKKFLRLCAEVAEMRARCHNDPELHWPDCTYGPSSLIRDAEGVQGYEAGKHLDEAANKRWTVAMTFVSWRMTQGVYEIDPEVFDHLWHTEPMEELPGEMLQRLPEWTVYVQTPPGTCAWRQGGRGFFAWVDCHSYTQEGEWTPTLILLPDLERNGIDSPHFELPLDSRTLDEGLWRTYALSGKEEAERVRESLWAMLSIVLYLCSANVEIVASGGKPRPAQRPIPSRPALEPRRWEVGWRIGATLKRARLNAGFVLPCEGDESVQTHASPRPHVRRAHFHGYWLGQRDAPDKRRLELKWLPPTFVNVAPGRPTVPTVHPVRFTEDE